MPRNRMIKSEFWTSEQVISCSPMARLLFIGLWNFADDNGVHPASYVKIKAEVFPADNIGIDEVKQWIGELTQQGLLREYEVDEKSYWIVTGWKAHQKIDKPTYKYPCPQSELKIIPSPPALSEYVVIPNRAIDNDSEITGQVVADKSTTTSRQVADYSTKGSDEREKKEKEKRNEKHPCEVETSPAPVSDSIHIASKQVFEYWQTVMNHPRAVFDRKRQLVIAKALKDYSLGDLKQAIDGCKSTPYNMGRNDRDQVYDDICLILRDSEHIERFMNNAFSKGTERQIGSSRVASNDLMVGVI